jgi:predicted transcriptional regulator
MNKRSIPQEAERSKKLNDALTALRNVYEPDVDSLVRLVYSLGGNQQQIADALGITTSMVSMRYPKKEKKS